MKAQEYEFLCQKAAELIYNQLDDKVWGSKQ